jgi:tetratricopeptide (TPR) repeat protein
VTKSKRTRESARDITYQGSKLSRSKALELEKKIENDNEDLESRVKLLGYYFRSCASFPNICRQLVGLKNPIFEKYQILIRWMIENYPDGAEAGVVEMNPPFGFDKTSFEISKELWQEKLKDMPENSTVLGNAASFFYRTDKEYAEKLLRQAQDLEPENPHWSHEISHLNRLKATSENPKQLQVALAEKEKAIEQSKRTNPYDLGDLAELAFALHEYERAEDAANRLLKLAMESQNKHYTDLGNGIHDGHSILGRLALRRNNLKEAKEHLAKASESPGSPSLNSFGPSMELAQDLLEIGETKCVIAYLLKCNRFWGGVHRWLTWYWILLIKLGRKPKLNRVGYVPEVGTRLSA